MPRYIALIEVQLDEPTIAGAIETARELATKICNDSLTTDIARATSLQRTGESYREELIDIDPSFSIVEKAELCPLEGSIGLCQHPFCVSEPHPVHQT